MPTSLLSRGLLIVSLLLVALPPVGATESSISIVRDGVELHGSLWVPPSSDPMPVALIIAGSGPTDRDGNNPMMINNSLKLLATGLADNGIATLRYDKRGIAASSYEGFNETDLRFEDYIDDAKAWIATLKDDQRFSAVWVIGHSEGSLIGMVASQQGGADGLVSVAGAGQSADLILKRQLDSQPEPYRSQMMEMIDQLASGALIGAVDPIFHALFRESVQPYMASWFQYDPREWIATLQIPVLIVQGTTDIQVTQDDATRLAQANPSASLVVIEGMNHVLKIAPMDRAANIQTYTDPALPLAPPLMSTLTDFITAAEGGE